MDSLFSDFERQSYGRVLDKKRGRRFSGIVFHEEDIDCRRR